MTKYLTQVQIADVTISFESDLESDISSLNRIFKYHRIDLYREPDCTVVVKRQSSFYMPKDAELQWRSKCHGVVVPPKKLLGKSRIRVFSKFDTFGVASCYASRERGEYYYGMMQDKSWICYRPSEHTIDYVLHRQPSRNGKLKQKEAVNPISAMPLLLHVIATVYGRSLTHGAAVCIDGKASLLLGRSGSGKSTLCADLARKKASFMGDDLVLVYMKDGVPMVGSLLFPAKLYLDSTTEKTNVDVPKEMQTGYSISAPLEAVYLVQQSGMQASMVESRPSAELLQQLMDASNGMIMQYDKQQWLETMYDISERVPYSIFKFGDRSTLDISLFKIS